MNNLDKARLMAAYNERSLIVSGYCYIGRFEYNGRNVVAYRHPISGKRAKVIWSNDFVELYLNGQLRERNNVY